jgi:hypothetical protein
LRSKPFVLTGYRHDVCPRLDSCWGELLPLRAPRRGHLRPRCELRRTQRSRRRNPHTQSSPMGRMQCSAWFADRPSFRTRSKGNRPSAAYTTGALVVSGRNEKFKLGRRATRRCLNHQNRPDPVPSVRIHAASTHACQCLRGDSLRLSCRPHAHLRPLH